MEWIEGLPTTAGRYWGYCCHDGDMMPVEVRVHQTEPDYRTLHNDSGACIGGFGATPPLIPPHLCNIFTHFLPYTEERPKPPRVNTRATKR